MANNMIDMFVVEVGGGWHLHRGRERLGGNVGVLHHL